MNAIHKVVRKMRTVIKKPKSLFIKPLYFLSPWLSDEFYLKMLFPLKVGYRLDLTNPQTYNEKLQWLKLYYRNPLLIKVSDKYEVRNHVEKAIGEQYLVKNYGVWNSSDDIDFDILPPKFVLKTTHDSGGVVICRDKETFDYGKAKDKLDRHLNNNLYYQFREWQYKSISPRIIAEEFLVDDDGGELKDYKFFCFNGQPKAMYIATDRQTGHVKFDYFDMEFNHLDFVQNYKQSGKKLDKPKNYDLMLEIVKKLSTGIPHVRIDLYNINGKILFGEYTFFHHGGVVPFYPKKWDFEFGSWIDLPKRSEKFQ